MPTYEYACNSCGEHLEVVQSFRDDALTECPACGGPLRKVFGSIGVVFKGSGFYKNDSRTASAKGKGTKETASPSTADSTSSGSSSSNDSSSAGSGDASTKKSGDGAGKSDGGSGSKPATSGSSKPGGSSKTAAAS